jgi:hypothetical protein
LLTHTGSTMHVSYRPLKFLLDYKYTMPKVKKLQQKPKSTQSTVAKQVRSALKQMKPFETGGTMLGGVVGTRMGYPGTGAFIGKRVGRFLGEITGLGSYTVKSNAILAKAGVTQDVPSFSRNNDAVIITHREYIGDIISSSTPGAFKIQTFAVNPSNSQVFPWLSQLADLYDQWEPLGIVFDYKSTSSIYNSTSQALGVVIMASQYDAYDAVFTNKVDMENSQFAVSCRTDSHILHPVECDPSERPIRLLYVGTDRGADKRFNNLVNVSVATQGIASADVNLGELWVTYKIKFYKPIIFRPLATNWYSANPNNTSASAFWGTMTRTPTSLNGYNANIQGVTFTTVSAGVGTISFTDPSTWARAYFITARVVGTIVASNATFYFLAGSQTVPITSLDQRAVLSLNTSPLEIVYTYGFIINKDPTSSASPTISMATTYISADMMFDISINIVELADFGLRP